MPLTWMDVWLDVRSPVRLAPRKHPCQAYRDAAFVSLHLLKHDRPVGSGPDQTLRDLEHTIPTCIIYHASPLHWATMSCLSSTLLLDIGLFSLGFPCFCPPYPPFLATPSSTPGCLPVDGPSAVPPNGPRAAARCLTRTHTLYPIPRANLCPHPCPDTNNTQAHTDMHIRPHRLAARL